MNNIIIILLYGVTFYFLNIFLIKKKLLLDQILSSSHKIFFHKKQIPLSGGILFLSLLILFLNSFDLMEKIIISSIFLIGLLSDINKLKSPLIRFILQLLSLILITYISNTFVSYTRLDYLDYFLSKYDFICAVFTIFCLLVFINGSNFIDGINSLASGYFISVILILIILLQKVNVEQLFLISNDLKIIITFLCVFFTFNFFSKSFLGDNGSYLISLVIGLLSIKISMVLKNSMSPFFIALLLWYPAFENLFSIIRRKFYQRKEIKNADNLHLHHLLFVELKKTFNDRLSNPLTGIIINSTNLIFFYLGLQQINNSITLIMLILIKSFIYLCTYLYLRKNN